nr:DNA-directed RNA polymerase II subunit rpb1 like [Ipomoea batatas]
MLHTKSESDVTSLAASSPSGHVYYVQSPSRDSHDDGEKSTSMQATPTFTSPVESPSHPSLGRHSRTSSGTRFSGIFRSSSGRKGRSGKRMSNDKGWPECNVIMEEGKYDEFEDSWLLSRRFQALLALCGFLLLFTVFCLIIWGAGRPYKAQITLKSLSVSNIYIGEGSDFTGVPTRLLSVNGSLRISVYNPATFYGIHVSSTPINLVFSDITVATGQLKKYYQPRKSRRTVTVNIQGTKVPLYGAGSSLTATKNKDGTGGVEVPLALDFEVKSQGDVVGKLVRTKHRRKIWCEFIIDSAGNKPIKFKKHSCAYT